MQRSIEDGLPPDQLRRIDRWMLGSLATLIAIALLALLILSDNAFTKTSKGQQSAQNSPKQTTGANPYPAGPGVQNSRGAQQLPSSLRPDVAQNYAGPRRRNGEQRQNLPVIY